MAESKGGGGGRSRKPAEDDDGFGRGEFRSSSDVRTGLIAGATFATKGVQYSVVEGMAIVEGDIVLGTVEEVEQRAEVLRSGAAGGVAASVIISGAQFRWPNCQVPFTIDPALPEPRPRDRRDRPLGGQHPLPLRAAHRARTPTG